MLYIAMIILGSVGGASGLYTLYTANVKKESITIGNLEKIIGDMRREINNLTEKVGKMEIDQNMYKKAISYGYKCKMCTKDAICPIILSLEEVEDKHKRSKK